MSLLTDWNAFICIYADFSSSDTNSPMSHSNQVQIFWTVESVIMPKSFPFIQRDTVEAETPISMAISDCLYRFPVLISLRANKILKLLIRLVISCSLSMIVPDYFL